mmetsp:Transcript_3787/g.5664  ORF Transcript_3787/g.5664 Transcript_3787/m.5664 type:complete len:99 (+) Transcript_3787:979-1275(+)
MPQLSGTLDAGAVLIHMKTLEGRMRDILKEERIMLQMRLTHRRGVMHSLRKKQQIDILCDICFDRKLLKNAVRCGEARIYELLPYFAFISNAIKMEIG